MSQQGRIKALDVNVVNKIAAGEIIISPVNALKEMLENSIDAGATMIDVLVKDGGIKVLQISDNGCGIDKEDLPILCERFTTSKLTDFEDLESISTYGFRGEALASISHIARVVVTTKTKHDKCAWKVSFAGGKMTSDPKPVAGKDGTTILVEDLFYNIPSRLRALRSPNDEYNKILDVLGKYSIHSKGIGFTCKKFGTSNLSLTVKPKFTIQDRIRSIYGNSVASSLISFEVTGDLLDLNIDKVEGQVTDLNFLSKKSTPPIFFINNRLVTCEPLRRSLQQVYQSHLPKGNKPFIYLNILIKPETVDVNVHPTKREVRFLNQDEIIDKVSLDLQQMLMNLDTSRTYKASSLLTGSQPIGNYASTKRDRGPSQATDSFMTLSTQNSNMNKSSFNANKIKKYDHNLIRTDSTQSKITTFLKSSQFVNEEYPTSNTTAIKETQTTTDLSSDSTESIEGNKISTLTGTTIRVLEEGNKENDENTMKDIEEEDDQDDDIEVTRIENSNKLNSSFIADKPNDQKLRYVISPKQRADINLFSIKQLREAVDDSTHRELTTVFANLTYVGVIDEERRLAAIQHDLKLFLVDYGSISYELFYQIGLTDFSNFGRINLNSSSTTDLNIMNVLNALDNIELNTKEEIILKLWTMREMLEEYFCIIITCEEADYSPDKIRITAIPLLLKGYTPPLSKMPYFLYRLGAKVNWEEEKQCFDDILHQIALFYIPEIIPKKEVARNDINEVVSQPNVEHIKRKEDMTSMLEHVLFPCIKKRLLAPRKLLKDVVEIANLPGLYKVFERC